MNGFVYIIRSHQTDKVYYGSTKQMLCKRMANHKLAYKRLLCGKGNAYTTSFEILKFDDAYIELIEEVKYLNKYELWAREGFYIRNNTCVNKVIPDRTKYEYTHDPIVLECGKIKAKLKRQRYNEKIIELRRQQDIRLGAKSAVSI